LLISQPAVSKQLQQLEQSLHTKLVDRRSKGVQLTEAGQVLAEYAKRIFSLANEAKHAIDDLSTLGRGRLSIGAGSTVGIYLLPWVLVQFRRRFPNIRLHLETEANELLLQRLRDGALDLVLTETAMSGSDVESKPFVKDVLVPIAACDHPIATTRRKISAAEFCRQPFVMRQMPAGIKSLVERTLSARGFEVEPILTVGSTEAIKQAVAAGYGVAIVSKLSIRTEIAAEHLVELPIRKLAIQYPLFQVQMKGSTESEAAKTFVTLAKQVAES
jgi:DNA-binding transcriptional LysR family regulator